MKVFQVEGAWTMDNVRLGTRPEPRPGPFEIRLAMRAAALNYRDLIVPLRGYGSRMKALPLITLGDGAGVVDMIGDGVTHVKIGDRVCPLLFPNWLSGQPNAERLSQTLGSERDGTMAEFMVLPETGVIPAPPHLSDEEAATLPTAAL